MSIFRVVIHSPSQNFQHIQLLYILKMFVLSGAGNPVVIKFFLFSGTGKGGQSIWGRKFEDELRDGLKV